MTNSNEKKPETEEHLEQIRSRDALTYDQVGRARESVAQGGLGGEKELRKSLMMARMLDSMKQDPPINVGHYGRLVFTMVARHFLSDDEMTTLLIKQPGEDELTVRSRILQVRARNYNPPKRDRILQWQREQQAGGVDYEIIPRGRAG